MELFIRLFDLQYPMYDFDVRQAAYPTALGELITEQQLNYFGFARVRKVPPPVADIGYYVKETPPTLFSGNYFQTYEIKSYDLQTKKIIKLQYFNKMFNDLIGQVKSAYPPTEVESWAKQEKEAREFLADNSSQAILIRSIASARGVPVEILAQKIVEKADQYGVFVGNLIGTRQMLEDQIESATEENIDSIKWPPEEN